MRVYVIGLNSPAAYSGIGKLLNTGDIITVVSIGGDPALFSQKEARAEIEECRTDVPELTWEMVWQKSVALPTLKKECGL